VGDVYDFLVPKDCWYMGRDVTQEQVAAGKLDEFDLIVVVDTSSTRQLPGLGDYLQKRSSKAKDTGLDVLVLDHHLVSDAIGSERVVDERAGATGQIIFELSVEAGWSLSKETAEALFVSIADDTGWFRFENCSARVLEIAGELVKAGVKPDKLYQRLYQNDSPARLRLRARAMDTLELHCDGRLAVMHISNEMLAACGAQRSDIENIVNEPQSISSVVAAILLVEQDNGGTRCSLRSKDIIDVNAIAKQFGGGGHARAAGLTVADGLAATKEKLVSIISERLPFD
jgi:phosphoesterase RecJ-like protein